MTRPLRLEYPGALWHVHNRGVEKRHIFLTDDDRLRFLEILAAVVLTLRWRVHAYALMPNHFHLLVETLDATLSRGARKLEGDYASGFNAAHDRVGHLFQGRFKSHLIDSETYLLEVARYIVLNPVRAKLVSTAEEWEWSSYRATAGLSVAPDWLNTAVILGRFDPYDPENARAAYRQFVGDASAAPVSPWKNLVAGSILGGRDFILSVQRRIDRASCLSGTARAQRVPARPSVKDVVAAFIAMVGRQPSRADRLFRMACAVVCRDDALATLRETGAAVGMTAGGVRHLLRRAATLRGQPDFEHLVAAMRLKIRNSK